MPSKIRLQRIADRIRDEISEMLVMQLTDPRLTGVTITDVNVDRELAYANIYVSALEGSKRADEIVSTLTHAKGFIRSRLAERIELRAFPNLRFYWDPTPEKADHIERLLNSLHDETQNNEEQEEK